MLELEDKAPVWESRHVGQASRLLKCGFGRFIVNGFGNLLAISDDLVVFRDRFNGGLIVDVSYIEDECSMAISIGSATYYAGNVLRVVNLVETVELLIKKEFERGDTS